MTISQAAECANLGTRTVRRIAEDSGALRKIGRCIRVDKDVFFEYIRQAYSE
ncbi:MAG TPA: helix-turn-helix domain-containing protein [Lacrimispora saccharolytica]|nr:helix-turn-helix domain-containing protein [Lacrimispora saccharolytica]